MVPYCLTAEERGELALHAKPPAWCIEMAKHPYDTQSWRALGTIVDKSNAELYGNWSDRAFRRGDFPAALEAADLGLTFDPDATWIKINRAHALMFMGKAKEASAEYLAGRGTTLPKHGKWEKAVVDDFAALKKAGLDHEQMKHIEDEFKKPLPKRQ